MNNECDVFKSRLTAKEPMVGTFMKTPSPIIGEILAMTSLDVICIDAEHSPFGRLETDHCIAALRAAGKPSLVRISNDSPAEIRNALDCGSTGILVPHVTSAEQARAIVRAAHFGDGGRGYAGSTRAAGYTTKPMPDHLADSSAQTTVVLQIEDIVALDRVTEIAAVDGVDCLFVGRIDLAVAMGKSPMDAEVIDCVGKICADAQKAGAAIGMFTPDLDELPGWQKQGASLFLLGSEHNMILSGASALTNRLAR